MLVNEEISAKELKKYDLVYLPMKEFINTIPGYQAQLLTFGLMIIVGVFLLNSWYRLVKEENENNATIKDFLILVLISIIYLAQWFLMP